MKHILSLLLLFVHLSVFSQGSYLKNGIVTHIKHIAIPDSLSNNWYEEQNLIITSRSNWITNDTIYSVFIDFNYECVFIENGEDGERFLLNETIGIYDENNTDFYIFGAVDGNGVKCTVSMVIDDKFIILVERNGKMDGYLINKIKDGYPSKYLKKTE